MRIIVTFIVLILIASGLYTAYGIFSFEPEKPRPLVFQEPTPESLRALGLLPKDSQEAANLTPEQQDQTQKAVIRVSDAITAFQKNSQGASLRLKGTLDTLSGAMASGRFPAYFLSIEDASHPTRKYETLNFNAKSANIAPLSPATLSCSDQSSVLLGNDGNDNLSCASTATTGDQIFIGGPGNDIISSAYGNRIVNPGGGDDTITLGPGRSIIVLDETWGHDTLTIDCKGASVAEGAAPKDFPVPWSSGYTNFIVLNPRIGKALSNGTAMF